MFTVVIADDEPYILSGLEKKLSWNDYDMEIVGKARNGVECLDMVRRTRPDLVITDIRMPGITGLELIEKLVKSDHHPVVVFMSGYSDFEYARKAIDLGALSYLLKPIGQKELRSTILRAGEELNRRAKNQRFLRARNENAIIEFLSTMPAGIERRVVMERLGLSGRNDEFLFIVTDRNVDADVLTSPLRDFVETSRVTLDERAALYVGNIVLAAEKSITRTIARLSSTLGVAIGVSERSAEVSDFPILLRQAKSAYFAEFVTGLKQAVIYERAAAPVLTVLANDFEALFAVGDESRLRRLTDQLPGLCSASRPTVDELLGLYNTLLTGANRILFADGRHDLVRGLLPDPDTMVRRFSSVHQLANDLHELLSDLFGSSGDDGRTEFAARDLVSSVRQYIRNNLSSNLSADGIATKFGVGRMALSTRFRAETGSSLPEYVRGARLDHAGFLLRHTALSVQEIAQMCGYDDYFYFARLFRSAKGMTASEFRKTSGETG